jgi:hypothetical protein
MRSESLFYFKNKPAFNIHNIATILNSPTNRRVTPPIQARKQLAIIETQPTNRQNPA